MDAEDLGDRHAHRQTNGPTGLDRAPAYDPFGSFGFDHRGPGVLVKVTAHLGEREAARRALNQPRAEAGFELRHALADRRLRHAETT